MFATGYALMGIAPTGSVFTFCFVISTFGLGFLPAVQSVATILHTGLSGEGDTGRLFGALGFVYVLGWVPSFHPLSKTLMPVNSGRIIGPGIYGAMYAVTVSFMPTAILWLSVACAMTAFLALAFVRLPDCASDVQHTEQQGGDPTHHDNTEVDPLLEANSPDQGAVYM